MLNRDFWGKKNPNWKGGKITKLCEHCQKKIEVFPCKIGRFCSRKCSSRGTIRIGENNPLWKGGNAQYCTLHDWIRLWRGTPEKCEFCGLFGEKVNGRWNIHWANKSREYKRYLEDWLSLCTPCHREYDRGYSRNR